MNVLSRHRRYGIHVTILAACLLLVSGCSIISDDGPLPSHIVNASKPTRKAPRAPFTLIDLTQPVADTLLRTAPPMTSGGGSKLPPPRMLGAVGPGDVLHITVWEADQVGANLLNRPSLDTTSRVNVDGTIFVPFAGRMSVIGRSPAAIEAQIQSSLASRVVAPQVSVLVTEDQTNEVIIQGDVVHTGRIPLAVNARHLLDVLALAGGTRDPDYRTVIQVTRGDSMQSLALSQILQDPSLNILLSPGDRVLVSLSNNYFYALGAVMRSGQLPYEGLSMTLKESLGRMGGLQDQRADPTGVFVFRKQDPALTSQLSPKATNVTSDLAQVAYHINMRDPVSFYVMSRFVVRPGDVIYVGSAPLAELSKFALILSALGTTGSMRGNFPY